MQLCPGLHLSNNIITYTLKKEHPNQQSKENQLNLPPNYLTKTTLSADLCTSKNALPSFSKYFTDVQFQRIMIKPVAALSWGKILCD